MDNFGEIVARTEQDLQDENNTHWSVAELQGYINRAQLEFCMEAKYPVILEPVAIEEDRFIYDTPSKIQEIVSATYLGLDLPIWTESHVEAAKREQGYAVTNGYPTPFGLLAISSNSVDQRSSYNSGTSWRFDTGTPRGLVVNERSSSTFRVYPIPDSNTAPYNSTVESGTDTLVGGGTSWTWTGDTIHNLPGMEWAFAVGEDSTNDPYRLLAWLDAHDYTDGGIQVTDDGDGFGFLWSITLDRQIGLSGVKRPDTMTLDADVPDVDAVYYEALVDGALYRAYAKDAPTQDRGKSDKHKKLFMDKASEARIKEELGSGNFYKGTHPTTQLRR